MRRTALTDYELGGKLIRAGYKVVMWYLSGNHDKAVFNKPEKLMRSGAPRREIALREIAPRGRLAREIRTPRRVQSVPL